MFVGAHMMSSSCPWMLLATGSPSENSNSRSRLPRRTSAMPSLPAGKAFSSQAWKILQDEFVMMSANCLLLHQGLKKPYGQPRNCCNFLPYKVPSAHALSGLPTLFMLCRRRRQHVRCCRPAGQVQAHAVTAVLRRSVSAHSHQESVRCHMLRKWKRLTHFGSGHALSA